MRWDRLFGELDARFEALADEQLMAEVAERTRAAAGAITLAARLAGALGQRIRIGTGAGASLSGDLLRVGPDWVLLQEAPAREALVALRHVTMVEGLLRTTGEHPSGVGLRLDLRHMVRGVARDRSPVAVLLTGSGAGGGPDEITGTIDRVGADFLELAVHPAWEPRRAADVRTVLAVPLATLAAVRSVGLS